MILMNIKCSSNKEMKKVRESFHNALIGSPAYKSSEIAILAGENENEDFIFQLVVGDANDNDIDITLEY